MYTLLVNVVNAVGTKFKKDVNSNIRYRQLFTFHQVTTQDFHCLALLITVFCFNHLFVDLVQNFSCTCNLEMSVGRSEFLLWTCFGCSFECLQDEDGEAVPAVQHCWNVTSGSTCHVTGLVPGHTYRIFVVANYGLVNAQQPMELQAKSTIIKYTTLGPPPAPRLKPIASDLYQVGAPDLPSFGL